MDPNDKTISSLQPNVYLERYNLKLQANKTKFKNCSAQQYLKKTFVFAVLLKRSFAVLRGY